MFKRKKKKKVEILQNKSQEIEILIEDEDITDVLESDINDNSGDYTFSDFDPELKVDDSIKDNEVVNSDEEIIEVQDEVINESSMETPEGPIKDLNTFFEKDRKSLDKLKIKEKKTKKKSRRSKKKERDLQEVKDRKLFKYNNKKYTKVEDFIKYLNDHYLDMDKIAKEVLDDENFYGWVSKSSGIFEKSLEEFKEIKQKIEK